MPTIQVKDGTRIWNGDDMGKHADDLAALTGANCRGFRIYFVTIFILCLFVGVAFPQDTFQSRSADVNGVKIHYLKSGSGPKTLVLIHGFGDTSRMWIPLFRSFGKNYTIIAPDMRGLGDSSRPANGYDKKTVANDIHGLVKSLGYEKIDLAGHDIGLMVAYAYA